MSKVKGRLRRQPLERFAGPEHVFNLAAMAGMLWREDHPAADGHRQLTLYHKDELTLVLFDFEAGSMLADHEADGYVTIQTISGELEVSTPAATRHLPPGSLLVLVPGVRHDVTARVASQMLLTVYLVKLPSRLDESMPPGR